MAASAMTETIMPPEMLANLKVSLHLYSQEVPVINFFSLNLWPLSFSQCAILMVQKLLGRYSKLELALLLKFDGKGARVPSSRQTQASHLLL
jgi:hypothetical protein